MYVVKDKVYIDGSLDIYVKRSIDRKEVDS